MSTILVTHPSADRYGSDLQLLETVTAFVDAGHRVRVVVPGPGPLVEMLEGRGAEVSFLDFPVLRKSMLSVGGLLRLVLDVLRTTPGMWRTIRSGGADVVWVNTVTTPSWALLARLARRHTVTHVHEAEEEGPRWARWGLTLPVSFSHRVVTNSRAAAETLIALLPRIAKRTLVVHNGMSGPPGTPAPPAGRVAGDPAHIALVARLSPRKGIDVALDALGLLRAEGRDVTLTLGGTAFEGYEWYEAELRTRAADEDLAGAVDFAGYVSDKWKLLARSDVVLVPSRVEPFGNTAVEALLANRPLVASATQGLVEIVDDGRTGRLVQPEDPRALAAAIADFLDDPAAASRIAGAGREDALARFSPANYATGVLSALSS